MAVRILASCALAAVAAAVSSAPAAAGEALAQESMPMQKQLQMPAQVRMPMPMPMPETGRPVMVRVRFNIQLPFTDGSAQTMARLQNRGRSLIYKMAREECAALKSTLAETCTLSGIRIDSRVREPRSNTPATLNVNGNARYAITLKDS